MLLSGSASSGSEGGPPAPARASAADVTTPGAGKRAESDFEFQEGANDIVAIVTLEIQGADRFATVGE